MVDMNDGNILTYTSSEEVLVFYWFYVEAKSGLFTWAANCVPLGECLHLLSLH